MTRHVLRCCLPLTVLLLLSAGDGNSNSSQKAQLARLQAYVGAWRGVGQLRRGSTQGAWTEQSEWAWHFAKDAPSLRFVAAKSKFFPSGQLRATGAGSYQLVVATGKDDAKLTYEGRVDESGKLVLEAKGPVAELPARISLRLVAGGDRLLVLYERKSRTSNRFLRMAEVGYTRQGSNFGKGTSYVECVVTGGKGTIPVTHEGQTYYVCCSGCRDFFHEDPAGVLAEYRERKAAERTNQKP